MVEQNRGFSGDKERKLSSLSIEALILQCQITNARLLTIQENLDKDTSHLSIDEHRNWARGRRELEATRKTLRDQRIMVTEELERQCIAMVDEGVPPYVRDEVNRKISELRRGRIVLSDENGRSSLRDKGVQLGFPHEVLFPQDVGEEQTVELLPVVIVSPSQVGQPSTRPQKPFWQKPVLPWKHA